MGARGRENTAEPAPGPPRRAGARRSRAGGALAGRGPQRRGRQLAVQRWPCLLNSQRPGPTAAPRDNENARS